jgi:hypothetical protein
MWHKILREEIKAPAQELQEQVDQAQVIQEEEQLQIQDYAKHQKEMVLQLNRVLQIQMF